MMTQEQMLEQIVKQVMASMSSSDAPAAEAPKGVNPKKAGFEQKNNRIAKERRRSMSVPIFPIKACSQRFT